MENELTKLRDYIIARGVRIIATSYIDGKDDAREKCALDLCCQADAVIERYEQGLDKWELFVEMSRQMRLIRGEQE